MVARVPKEGHAARAALSSGNHDARPVDEPPAFRWHPDHLSPAVAQTALRSRCAHPEQVLPPAAARDDGAEAPRSTHQPSHRVAMSRGLALVRWGSATRRAVCGRACGVANKTRSTCEAVAQGTRETPPVNRCHNFPARCELALPGRRLGPALHRRRACAARMHVPRPVTHPADANARAAMASKKTSNGNCFFLCTFVTV